MATITCPKCKKDYWDSYSKCPTCGEINPVSAQIIKSKHYGFFGGVKTTHGLGPRTSKAFSRGRTLREGLMLNIAEKGAQLAICFVAGAILIGIGGSIGGPYVGIAAILAGFYTILPNEAEILQRLIKKRAKGNIKQVKVDVESSIDTGLY